MNKKKILFIANDTAYLYNTRYELARQLVSKGFEVVMVSKMLSHCEDFQKIGAKLINETINRSSKNPMMDFCLLNRFRKTILHERPDIVLTFNIKSNVYAGIVCQISKIPYISNITGLGTPVENPSAIQWICILLYKMGCWGAKCIMFQNTENLSFFRTKKMIRNGTRTRILPGSGVDLEKHIPLPYPPKTKTYNFLFVARILKEKGIDLYINAAKRIHAKHPEACFHICGMCDDSKYISVLKDLETTGFIKYHGEQNNMIPFYEMANCIVHPSYYPEGMSNVLLEASAHARPVITTSRSGCREAVDDGITGYIIPIKDEDSLVEALSKFLALSWEQKRDMGLAARKKIEREFDRRIVTNAYLEELGNITQVHFAS